MAEITENPHGRERDENPRVSHERKDVNVFQITAFGIGLLIGCIVVVFAMWGLFDLFYSRESAKNPPFPPAMMNERPKLPPEPRLQANPKVELKDLRDSEDAILDNYGWIDPNKGIVRIPVEQAIDIVIKKGLPSKPSPSGSDRGGYRTIPEYSSSGRTLERIAQ
jgi:hypothetical protein